MEKGLVHVYTGDGKREDDGGFGLRYARMKTECASALYSF